MTQQEFEALGLTDRDLIIITKEYEPFNEYRAYIGFIYRINDKTIELCAELEKGSKELEYEVSAWPGDGHSVMTQHIRFNMIKNIRIIKRDFTKEKIQ